MWWRQLLLLGIEFHYGLHGLHSLGLQWLGFHGLQWLGLHGLRVHWRWLHRRWFRWLRLHWLRVRWRRLRWNDIRINWVCRPGGHKLGLVRCCFSICILLLIRSSIKFSPPRVDGRVGCMPRIADRAAADANNRGNSATGGGSG